MLTKGRTVHTVVFSPVPDAVSSPLVMERSITGRRAFSDAHAEGASLLQAVDVAPLGGPHWGLGLMQDLEKRANDTGAGSHGRRIPSRPHPTGLALVSPCAVSNVESTNEISSQVPGHAVPLGNS